MRKKCKTNNRNSASVVLFPKISKQEMGEMGDSGCYCLVHRLHFVIYYANRIQGNNKYEMSFS